MGHTIKPLGQQIELLRKNTTEDLKSLIRSRRRSRENEIVEIIESFTEGNVKAESKDNFTVIVSSEEETKKFLLFEGDELDPGQTVFNDLHGLCAYLVDKSLYEYSEKFVESVKF